MYCQLDRENIQCDQSVITELGGFVRGGKAENVTRTACKKRAAKSILWLQAYRKE